MTRNTGNIPHEIPEQTETLEEADSQKSLDEQDLDNEECLSDEQLQRLGVEEYDKQEEPTWVNGFPTGGVTGVMDEMQRMLLERLNSDTMTRELERMREENERRAIDIARAQEQTRVSNLRFGGGDPISEIRGQRADFMVMDELDIYNRTDADLVDRLTEEAIDEINRTSTTNATPREDEEEGALRLRQIQEIMRALDI
jgi:hypothetical protein